MGEMTNEGSNLGAGIDLSQFYQVFFEEAGENLDNMEQLLLNVNVDAADDEELNAIFRCAHSIKGGAATFGFADVAELTHIMETLLDKLRRHELQPTTQMIDILLQAGDALKGLLARHAGTSTAAVESEGLVAGIRTLVEGGKLEGAPAPAPKVSAPPPVAAKPSPAPLSTKVRELELLVGPLDNPSQADNLVELFKEITDLGTIESLDGGQAADGMRRFKIVTGSSDNDLLDLFTFHVAREQVKLVPFGVGYGFHEGAPGAPPAEPKQEPGYGFFDDAPGSPVQSAASTPAAEPAPAPAASAVVPTAKPAAAAAAPKPAAAGDQSTLRVSIEKVDQLINLVGELVITQAMLAQNSRNVDPGLYQQLTSGLADLERNTRDLQEAVMSIRMIPMSVVFNRFPRMLRDLAAKLGKKVELLTQGEATELDKGLVEKITDPLTHLVRNSCDHGIEMPADRLARGKPEQGTITLIASHQGGSIVIEVRDDGRGLNRQKLISKAQEKGIDAHEGMS
ncbi:MAG: Hpt domain-containing protein, partial [Inhella sp.]